MSSPKSEDDTFSWSNEGKKKRKVAYSVGCAGKSIFQTVHDTLSTKERERERKEALLTSDWLAGISLARAEDDLSPSDAMFTQLIGRAGSPILFVLLGKSFQSRVMCVVKGSIKRA